MHALLEATNHGRHGVSGCFGGVPYSIACVDCFEWMERGPEHSVHAIVTDPPYGLKEYTPEQTPKLRRKKGGVWRIPPSFDGCERNPLPRFTVLTDADREGLREFFSAFAKKAFRILVPGGHVFTPPTLCFRIWCICRSSKRASRSGARLSDWSKRCAAGIDRKMRMKSSQKSPLCRDRAGSPGGSFENPARGGFRIISGGTRRADSDVLPEICPLRM